LKDKEDIRNIITRSLIALDGGTLHVESYAITIRRLRDASGIIPIKRQSMSMIWSRWTAHGCLPDDQWRRS
jgi:hypothetical protein